MKKKGVFLVSILCVMTIVFSGCDIFGNRPEYIIDYSIINYAYTEATYNGIESVFEIRGQITLKNFKCKRIIITAKAVDNLGTRINVFSTNDIFVNGDGIYEFVMPSYYRNGERIIGAENFEVKELNF